MPYLPRPSLGLSDLQHNIVASNLSEFILLCYELKENIINLSATTCKPSSDHFSVLMGCGAVQDEAEIIVRRASLCHARAAPMPQAAAASGRPACWWARRP